MGSIDAPVHDESIPRSIFLFTHPRTASNLFVRLFSNHPQLSSIGYSFFNAFMHGPEKQYQHEHPDPQNPGGIVIDNSRETFQVAFDRLHESMSKAIKEGKTPLLKEHAFVVTKQQPANETAAEPSSAGIIPQVIDKSIEPHAEASRTNPTLLPDRFLQSLVPVILYRHPAKAVPSMYRTLSQAEQSPEITSPDFAIHSSLHAQVLLLKWYKDQRAAAAAAVENLATALINGLDPTTTEAVDPLVIEADDLINSDMLVQKLCHRLHIDPAHVRYQWEAVSDAQNPQLGPAAKVFLGTLNSSTGILKSGVRDVDVDLEKEKEKWIAEFGEEEAKGILALVEGNMEDYYYLRDQRLTGG